MLQPGGFLVKLLRPLLKTELPLMKNAIKPLAKSVLIPLGLTAAASTEMNYRNELDEARTTASDIKEVLLL